MVERVSSPVYFVHISDTHIGPSREFELYGRNTFACTKDLLRAIAALPLVADFIVHTGDIVNSPDPEAYRLASQLFKELTMPMYFVTGNHDNAKAINENLRLGPTVRKSEDLASLYYSFGCKGQKFVVLNARGPDEIDPSGLFPEGQIEFLEAELATNQAPISVFIHFPPLPLDSRWLDERMLLLNGSNLHEALLPVRERVRGVFYGHVHRGIQQLKDGILYSSVASSFRQFSSFPSDEKPVLDAGLPAFNIVTLFPDRTIVKEHTVAAPQ